MVSSTPIEPPLATLSWIDETSYVALALANPHAKKLYDDLLSNYNRLIRPVSNNTEKLTVKLGLKLSQLIDVVSIHFFIESSRMWLFHLKLKRRQDSTD